jgi:dUTP pyrophosphatase
MGKHGVTLANSIGIIDADYRGPLGVTLINNAAWSQAYLKGDRIAQLVVLPFLLADPVPVEELTVTERGEGGFGSTGR